MEAMEVTSEHVQRVLRRLDAIRVGHFVGATGLHNSLYIDETQLTRYPRELDIIAGGLAWLLRNSEATIVVSLSSRALPIGYSTAFHLDRLSICMEKGPDTPPVLPKADRTLVGGASILIVDDSSRSGTTLVSAIQTLEEYGARIVTAAVLCDRSNGRAPRALAALGYDPQEFLVPLLTLDREKQILFTPDECAVSGPCAQGTPINRQPGFGAVLETRQPDHPCGFTD